MAKEMAGPVIISTDNQTQGRGQKGNSWESEPGKNLTFSLMWHPENFEACRQFSISEAIAISVVDLLKEYGVEAKVKWPNDIYVGDKKISGILIEHSLSGRMIESTVAGVGLNINQLEFLSDAPNPVSLAQIKSSTYDLDELLSRFGVLAESRIVALCDEEERLRIHHEFLAKLWRGDGAYYPFRERSDGRKYYGRIIDVEPTGYLNVEERGGEIHKYAFKEVEFLLNDGF